MSRSSARVIFLTSGESRHRYAATRIVAGANLVGIVSEAKRPAVVDNSGLSPADHEVIAQHLKERDEAEKLLLGNQEAFPGVPLLEMSAGRVNDPEVLRWIDDLAPDFLILFGTSIVRDRLLKRYENRILNVHLGLSPYYRGSATNFWPLVYEEPECVGATIHIAVAEVDAGGILAQVRPEPSFGDRAHQLGTKVMMAAFDILPFVLRAYTDGRIQPQRQTAEGRVFRRADFNAAAVRAMWRNFESGMINRYVADAYRRRAERPIIEFSNAGSSTTRLQERS